MIAVNPAVKAGRPCLEGLRADLHMHSHFSDGSDSAEKLAEKIYGEGISVFALTDHDTADGCAAVQKAVKEICPEVHFIPGIEFSCKTGAGKCHILGYGCDTGHPAFLDAVEEGRKMRRENLKKRLDTLEHKDGIPFTEAEKEYLYSLPAAGKPHIAEILVKKGIVSEISQGIEKYLKGSRTGSDRISAETAVHAIAASGGIPVWAHPLGGEGEKRPAEGEFERQLEMLLSFGIRGLECYYSRYSAGESSFLRRQAEHHGLLISGGSDYHGSRKNIEPGCLNCQGQQIGAERLTILRKLL